jgi:hypothetical protein
MSHTKINSIISAFTEQMRSTKWASESNGVFAIGQDLLRDLLTMKIPASEIEARTNIILMGTLVTAVAENQRKYGKSEYSYISNNKRNDFYQVPFYPLKWSELHLQCDMDSVLKQYDKKDERFRYISKENPIYLNMIERIGSGIMTKKLPFKLDQLKAGFPQLSAHFDNIADPKSNTEEQQVVYQAIKTELEGYHIVGNKFDEIIASMKNSTALGEKQQQFIDALTTLKTNTLISLKAGNPLFNFDSCMIMTANIETLTAKIKDNKVSQQDLNTFNDDMEPLKTSKWFITAIAALIGAVVGGIAGFFLAGIPGAVAGAVVGGSAAGAYTMWHVRKQDPLIQIGNLAGQVVTEEPQTVNNLG